MVSADYSFIACIRFSSKRLTSAANLLFAIASCLQIIDTAVSPYHGNHRIPANKNIQLRHLLATVKEMSPDFKRVARVN